MSGGLGWPQSHVGWFGVAAGPCRWFGRQQSAVGWLGRDTNVSLRVLQGTARGGSLILHCAKSVTKQREKLHDGSVLGEASPSAVTVTDQSWGNLTVSGDCGGSVLGKTSLLEVAVADQSWGKPHCQQWLWRISPGGNPAVSGDCGESVLGETSLSEVTDGSVLGETSPSAVTVTHQSWGKPRRQRWLWRISLGENLVVRGDCGGSVLGETSPSAVTVADQSWGNLTVSGDCGGSVLGKPRCQGWISPGETSLWSTYWYESIHRQSRAQAA